MSGRRSGAWIVALALGGAAILGGGSSPADAAPQQDRDASDLVLVRQTPTLAAGGVLELVVQMAPPAPAMVVEVSIHDRVRSRSELTTSAAGDGLRRRLRSIEVAAESLPTEGEGRRITVPLSGDGGEDITTPGVYPVQVQVRVGSGSLGTLVSHLIVPPPADSASPPLAVAPLVTLDGPPGVGAKRSPALDGPGVASARALVDAVNAAPAVVATFAVRPELVDELTIAADDASTALLASLRAAAGRAWLALPYASVSPDALAEAGIPEELLHHLGHGAAVLRDVLGVTASESTWLAGTDLGARGLPLLPSSGIEHVLLDPDQVQAVADGVLSVARPFRVAPPRSTRSSATDDVDLDGMVTDRRILEQIGGDAPPALLANRVLAELASLWFEQERTPRGVVLPLDPGLDQRAVRAVLEGLEAPTLFDAVPLDEIFTTAEPLLGRDREPLPRALHPEDGSALGGQQATRVRSARSLRGSVAAMVGSAPDLLGTIDGHLLRATAEDLDDAERRRELVAVQQAVDAFTAGITTPGPVTITLTAREGTVPLTIRNDTGVPVDVRLRLRSPKLELPDGETLTLRLIEPVTRRDIAVRTRASGAFPIEVEITSPDGRVPVTTTRFSVRSTAVSGVGVLLSAGAGLFLVIWWARHWRQTRRSAKLVPSREG